MALLYRDPKEIPTSSQNHVGLNKLARHPNNYRIVTRGRCDDDYDYPAGTRDRQSAASRSHNNSAVLQFAIRLDLVHFDRDAVLLERVHDVAHTPITALLATLVRWCRDGDGIYHHRGTMKQRRLIVSPHNPHESRTRLQRLIAERTEAHPFGAVDGANVLAIVLYLESTLCLVSIRSLATQGRVRSVQVVREDVPLVKQVDRTISGGSSDYALLVSPAPRSPVGEPGGTEATDCVTCDDMYHVAVNTIWLDSLTDAAAAATLPCQAQCWPAATLEIVPAVRFFLYDAVGDANCRGHAAGQHCAWHAWSGRHCHWLRRYVVGNDVTTANDSAAVAAKRHAIFHDICREGFYTCGIYEISVVTEVAAASDNAEHGGQEDLVALTNESHRPRVLLFQRSALAFASFRNGEPAFRAYPYDLIINHDVSASHLRVRLLSRTTRQYARTLCIRPKHTETLAHISCNLAFVVSRR